MRKILEYQWIRIYRKGEKMVDIQYANSIAELLYYLKGIDEEDLEKIPSKLMIFWKENASKDYICSFDYTKQLEELQYELSDDTLGLIGMICYNYWCESEEEKESFVRQLEENDELYREEIREKFDWKRNSKNDTNLEQIYLVQIKKETLFRKIINRLKSKIRQLFEKD